MATQQNKAKNQLTSNKRIKKTDEKAAEICEGERPRSLDIAAEGIRTGGDFARMMSALMSDIIEGKVTPQVGNATVNAGGKLLKVVEMQCKYGTQSPKDSTKILDLIGPEK